MCLIVLSWQQHRAYPLILAANRDEFYARPSEPLHWWPDAGILAGRDLEGGGTWMGLSRDGKFAAVTNVRDPRAHRPEAPSRGRLVTDYLVGNAPPSDYVESVSHRGQAFNGFNLLAGDLDELYSYSNRGHGPVRLSPGLYGLSNDILDTPWPKVERSKQRLARMLRQPEVAPTSVREMLSDPEPAPDDELPDTGIDRDLERALSAPFIRTPDYGTRVSSLLLIRRNGEAEFYEWGHFPAYERSEGFRIEPR